MHVNVIGKTSRYFSGTTVLARGTYYALLDYLSTIFEAATGRVECTAEVSF